LNFWKNVLFQAREFQKKSGRQPEKTSIVTPPEKTENGIGDDTWLVLNVLDQSRFTVVRLRKY
jgi:hypothetical protein